MLPRHRSRRGLVLLGVIPLLLALSTPAPPAGADVGVAQRYLVVLRSFSAAGSVSSSTAKSARALVESAGGSIVYDLSRQIGVIVASSPNTMFDETVAASSLVAVAAEDFRWKGMPSTQEALSSGDLVVVGAGPQAQPCSEPDPSTCPPGGPEPHADVLEGLEWSKQQIRAPQAHEIQAGSRAVQVGILDSGIDGQHADFVDEDGTNVDCASGRDFVPLGPGIASNPAPCVDNQFHGTHVAGIVAARANGDGVVGVAPNVTLIPVKVCDAEGYCYASSTAAGITYAGDAKFEVINMSFFVDDDQYQQSTEFKCTTDPIQRAFRKANERAIQYARQQGVVPVAALGNSDNDLAHPPEPYENNCEVVPAETQGVIGTASLGPTSEKAYYSNYGFGMTDVAAPGGNSRNNQGEIPGPCGNQVLSTIPGNVWGCFQGTSMASPHATGVAALIVSQFGRIGNDAGTPDVLMRPTEVESYLQASTIDIGLRGYDECFGNGRIDALRAVQHDTKNVYELNEFCPEYSEPPNA